MASEGGVTVPVASSQFTTPVSAPDPPGASAVYDLGGVSDPGGASSDFFSCLQSLVETWPLILKVPLPLGAQYPFPRRATYKSRLLSGGGKLPKLYSV